MPIQAEVVAPEPMMAEVAEVRPERQRVLQEPLEALRVVREVGALPIVITAWEEAEREVYRERLAPLAEMGFMADAAGHRVEDWMHWLLMREVVEFDLSRPRAPTSQ